MLTCCLDAIASGGNPQDRNGAFSVGELNSPRVAPLHPLLKSCFRSLPIAHKHIK
ncbi:hypothetical protein BJP36_36700 [Moorena producens JHB]|uniref:Uncharacterized protein n=1 Tax=Moorena producens (strain JHB) TaxID=1454205 RepID=A0A9Q9UW89_MOOP1|nr:hypothetical protein [Moorena producens]WAN69636.1 hypothetical protein BJP36_36700 [Moorena producens JHB]